VNKTYGLDQLHGAYVAGQKTNPAKLREFNYAAALETVMNGLAEAMRLGRVQAATVLSLHRASKKAFSEGKPVKVRWLVAKGGIEDVLRVAAETQRRVGQA